MARVEPDSTEAPPLHRPLSSDRSTRILRLSPGVFADRIHGELFEIQIPAASDAPSNGSSLAIDSFEYEAISYTWGSPKHMKTIHLNGRPVEIRENLFNCLRRVRYQDTMRDIWVDALCISQTDLQEKSAQVAMIGDIFKQATLVIAWVGEHADESELIFDPSRWDSIRQKLRNCDVRDAQMRRLLRRTRDCGCSYRPHEKSDEVEDDLFGMPLGADAYGDYFNAGILRVGVVAIFLSRPYFQRCWIYQELAIAKKVHLQCGPSKLDYSDLQPSKALRVGGDFVFKHGQTPVSELCAVFEFADFVRKGISEHSFLQIMHLLIDAQCEDRRDRVFSTLSLHSSLKAVMRPDYSMSVPELYLAVLDAEPIWTRHNEWKFNSRLLPTKKEDRGAGRHLYLVQQLGQCLRLKATEYEPLFELLLKYYSEQTTSLPLGRRLLLLSRDQSQRRSRRRFAAAFVGQVYLMSAETSKDPHQAPWLEGLLKYQEPIEPAVRTRILNRANTAGLYDDAFHQATIFKLFRERAMKKAEKANAQRAEEERKKNIASLDEFISVSEQVLYGMDVTNDDRAFVLEPDMASHLPAPKSIGGRF